MLRQVLPGLPAAGCGSSPGTLELGCGAGNFSSLLAAQGYAVAGVDISATAVAWAQERRGGGKAGFRVDDVVELAAGPDASFDAVVDGHCLHCIVDADRALCIDSIFRVLGPGGSFVVLKMCGAVPDPRLLQSFDPANQLVLVDSRPTRHIGSVDRILTELRRAGFEIVSSTVEAWKTTADQDDQDHVRNVMHKSPCLREHPVRDDPFWRHTPIIFAKDKERTRRKNLSSGFLERRP